MALFPMNIGSSEGSSGIIMSAIGTGTNKFLILAIKGRHIKGKIVSNYISSTQIGLISDDYGGTVISGTLGSFTNNQVIDIDLSTTQYSTATGIFLQTGSYSGGSTAGKYLALEVDEITD